MKKYATIIVTAALLCCTGVGSAQPGGDRYKTVDEYVQSLGSLDTLNVGTISHILTKKFPESTDKVRAIFYWIANNISIDVKLAKNGSNEKMVSEAILKSRKANANGYATLFQDMCSVAKIRCLTVDGYIKKTVEDINNVPDELNHTWAVIQLGQSPEAWYYVDPEWGSGYVDEKATAFIKKFDDRYFFANKQLFNLQHFPDNMAWQLGNSGPKSIKDFFAQPIVKRDAIEFGLVSGMPNDGFIKANTKKAVAFNLKVAANTKIDIVSLQLGTGKKSRTKTVDYSFNNGTISFSYKFDEEDSYPVSVLINNKAVLGYFAEISE
jgi:Transglutaminase-like superfamily